MKALVTGAAGFVGSHLSEALLERGDDVVGVDCFTPYYERERKVANADEVHATAASCSAAFELVDTDLRATDIGALLDGVDVVFHQAAQPGVRLSWADGFATYAELNVLATQRLLEAVRVIDSARRPKVVYASSSSVYGNQPRYPTVETDLPAPHSPYGVTKLAAEHLCGLYAANYGIETVSLRYFTVFGPRQRPDMSIHRLCAAVVTGETFPRYGDGTQIREFTEVRDIVAGNLAAADHDVVPGTYLNLAGGGEITLNELIVLIGELAGAPVAVEARAAQPGDSFRNGGSTDRARALLGWEPTVSLRDGLARQLAWHRASSP
ncbi:MAG TPA: NAD-dependent epimerase/dehydratase family protein [Acidimicrobiia bacterium]